MKKYSVEIIKGEATRKIKQFCGKKRNSLAQNLKVCQMRTYMRKVLFLCKEIKRLEKKLSKP
ncbi:hypothetical protein LCGC14_0346160 [marine sediment metagenome]|uniref:Uncharacterized protein n=1 Tax=marine sediment metagenome TaxID=412755 RepID=A0A0F9THX9_9ZZZZ